MIRNRTPKLVMFALIVLIIAGATYAFADLNTIPESSVGYVVDTVAGYAVTAIDYSALATDMSKLSKVGFTLTALNTADTAQPDVFISTDPASPPLTATFSTSTCVESAGALAYEWLVVCTYTGGSEPLIADVDALHVLAGSNMIP